MDLWGFFEKLFGIENDFSMWARVLKVVIMLFNLLVVIRAVGFWGMLYLMIFLYCFLNNSVNIEYMIGF